MNLIRKVISGSYPFFTYLRRDIAGIFRLDENFFKSARGSRIIIYHGICQTKPTRFNTLFIRQKTFESHLRFYKKYFNVVSLADFYSGNFNKDRFNICLSFDDGFANNHKYVLPLLEKYQLPATFFITAIRKEGYDILWNDFLTIGSTEWPEQMTVDNEVFKKGSGRRYLSTVSHKSLADILRNDRFDAKKKFMELLEPRVSFKKKKALEDYWLQMTVGDIKNMAASPLVTIGSHGFYHNDLARIPQNDMISELTGSKIFLENIIQKPVTALAFPYGSYSPKVVEEATRAGYQQLLGTAFIYDNDAANSTMRERMGINPFISVHNQMYANIKGNYA